MRGTKKNFLFGDNIRAAKLPGDGFRSRHDLVKNFYSESSEQQEFQLSVRSSTYLQENCPKKGYPELSERTCETMVPDLKISIPEAGGRSEQRLFELKVVSSCPTRYPRELRSEGRAVDNRATATASGRISSQCKKS